MFGNLTAKVVVAALAAVGIEEFLKNFISFKNSKWYAVLMLPLSVGCFLAMDLLPIYVIGSVLTVGGVQLCYQSLVQGFKAIIGNLTGQLGGKPGVAAETAPQTLGANGSGGNT